MVGTVNLQCGGYHLGYRVRELCPVFAWMWPTKVAVRVHGWIRKKPDTQEWCYGIYW
jgi:hypothetical protein